MPEPRDERGTGVRSYCWDCGTCWDGWSGDNHEGRPCIDCGGVDTHHVPEIVRLKAENERLSEGWKQAFTIALDWQNAAQAAEAEKARLREALEAIVFHTKDDGDRHQEAVEVARAALTGRTEGSDA